MSQLWAIMTAGVLLMTFGANEVSHGGVAETMGLGHHHMADHGGYHCASHDDADHAERHHQHMHGQALNGSGMNNGGPGPHDHASCYGSGDPMHEEHRDAHGGQMGPGGHMGGG